MNEFKTIVFSKPGFYKNEASQISLLLESGIIDYVHLRKPESDFNRLFELIKAIPSDLHKKIKIHDHFNLLEKFQIGGVHLNSRNPSAPEYAPSVSASCHSLEEIDMCSNYTYVTLSPIFNSISKPGYNSAFDISKTSSFISDKRVIALGGIRPEHFPILKKSGFYGAAMLGSVWSEIDTFGLGKTLLLISKYSIL